MMRYASTVGLLRASTPSDECFYRDFDFCSLPTVTADPRPGRAHGSSSVPTMMGPSDWGNVLPTDSVEFGLAVDGEQSHVATAAGLCREMAGHTAAIFCRHGCAAGGRGPAAVPSAPSAKLANREQSKEAPHIRERNEPAAPNPRDHRPHVGELV